MRIKKLKFKKINNSKVMFLAAFDIRAWPPTKISKVSKARQGHFGGIIIGKINPGDRFSVGGRSYVVTESDSYRAHGHWRSSIRATEIQS